MKLTKSQVVVLSAYARGTNPYAGVRMSGRAAGFCIANRRRVFYALANAGLLQAARKGDSILDRDLTFAITDAGREALKAVQP